MQPIFLIAVLAAALALGLGYLGNEVDLEGMVQEFGVGEGTIEPPTETADIKAKIVRTGQGQNFKDLIIECVFLTPDTIASGSMIFCKILDGREDASTIANIIAEGMKTTGTVPPNTTVTIPITFLAFTNANDVDFSHDMIVVIKGP